MKRLNVRRATGPDGTPPFIVRKLATTFAVSLTIILNCSLLSGIFPDVPKKSTVKPLMRNESPEESGDFRPISLMSVFSKVFEKLIHYQLYSYLGTNGFLSPNQHGYRQKMSTATLLLETVYKWRGAVDEGKVAGAVFLDPKKLLIQSTTSVCVRSLIV